MLAWARCHTWRGLDTDAPTRRRPRRRAKEPASVPVVSNGVRLPRWRRSIRSAPDQTSQARLTNEALRNGIQGTVVLEAIVTGDGWPSQIRVVRSLDRGGLDEKAMAAVAQWRFEPGRLAGAPVDVLVTIMVDFWIR